jgi:hypothetical protein
VQAGVGLMVLQQFSGVNAVMFYSGTIFRAAGVKSADAAAFTCGLLQVSRLSLLPHLPEPGQRLRFDRCKSIVRITDVSSFPHDFLTS